MAHYDRVLVDPSRDELDRALQAAVEAANERRKQRLVPWPLPDSDALSATLENPFGYQQWNGGNGPARPGEGRGVVVLAWWTDRASRKHHRILGRHGLFNRPMLQNLLCPFGDLRPPLWFVYPDHVYLKRQRGDRLLQAMCACGAHGTPEELGWMGPSCDACYDLGEEGQTPANAWLDPRTSTLRGEEGRLQFLAFSPNGRTLAAGAGRDHVVLWDPATGMERGRLVTRQDEWLLGVGWLDEGQRVVTADAAGHLRYWSGRTGLPTGDDKQLSSGECFAVSPDSSVMGRGNRSGATLLTTDGEQLRELDGKVAGISCLAFSTDGKLVAGGSRQGMAAIWDSGTGTLLHRIDRPGAMVSSLAFSPQGRTLAVGLLPAVGSTATEAQRILLVNVKSGETECVLAGHAGGTRCVAYAPDGRLLVSGGEDGLVRLWDVHSGQERVALEWHLDCVSSVAFAPDGLTLASGSFDGTIKLWPREVLRPVSSQARGPLVGVP